MEEQMYIMYNIKLTIVKVFCTLKESWNVMLEDCEGFVQLLKDADNGVALLHVVHGLLHGNLSVEASGMNKK